jgi:uncharacterized protein YeaO (DUF488 family)
MIFHTSNYASLDKIPENYIKVSISGAISDQIAENIDVHEKRLAPSWDIYKEYKETNDYKLYTKRFKEEILSNVDLDDIIEELRTNYGDKHVVLLCYEKPNEFCHRHIVAEAIEEKYGIQVPEVGIDYLNYERKKYKYFFINKYKIGAPK